MSLAEDLQLALQLADDADAITLARFRASDLAVQTKPDMTPVSEADTAVEQSMRARLAVERPGDAIVGEEYGSAGVPENGRRWIVDPIDGTKGYVRGMPIWATLLALEEDGEITVGVASAPALGRRWWAARGGGAFVRESGVGGEALMREDGDGDGDGDGGSGEAGGAVSMPRPLRVSAVRSLEDSQLCFGGFEDWRAEGRFGRLTALGERVWRVRGYGDFWQYMLVAEGAAEIATDPNVSLWDLAVPLIVVTEAGGRFTDFTGTVTATGRSALATNGHVHDAARAILAG